MSDGLPEGIIPPQLGFIREHSEEWYEARASRIGGSEIGAIMGWSRWDTPWSLAERKLFPPAERKPTTPRQQIGHDAESMLALALERKLELKVNTSPGTWADDLAIANPDGLIEDGSLAEFKTVDDRHTEDGWGRAGTGQVPQSYLAQTIWYMGATGAKQCWLTALCGALNGRPGLHIAHYKIKFDEIMYQEMRNAAEDWYELHILDPINHSLMDEDWPKGGFIPRKAAASTVIRRAGDVAEAA